LLVIAVALVTCNAALEVFSRPTSRLDRDPDVESELA